VLSTDRRNTLLVTTVALPLILTLTLVLMAGIVGPGLGIYIAMARLPVSLLPVIGAPI
jgi:hypothetical protein